eukprot:394264-Pyramimonas_sp.AAC.1
MHAFECSTIVVETREPGLDQGSSAGKQVPGPALQRRETGSQPGLERRPGLKLGPTGARHRRGPGPASRAVDTET